MGFTLITRLILIAALLMHLSSFIEKKIQTQKRQIYDLAYGNVKSAKIGV